MPPKNSIKQYEEGAFYHIYNRGVEKRSIFLDDQDYKVFLSYLKLYLVDPALQGSPLQVSPSKQLKNYAGEIELHCYCLMPNHFHLLVRQNSQMAIKSFMMSLATKYSIYFNKKYKRVGRLFQGIYKAVKVDSEEQLVHLSKYIHLNSAVAGSSEDFSSLPNYLGAISQEWVNINEILWYFSKTNRNLSYESFLGLPEDYFGITNLLMDLQG